jgi:hypothetical protein
VSADALDAAFMLQAGVKSKDERKSLRVYVRHEEAAPVSLGNKGPKGRKVSLSDMGFK